MNVLPPHKTGLNLLVIDFETYFDSDCTLKKLNPIEYIKHPKFDVLGASIIHQSAWHIRKGFRPTDNLKAFLDKLDPSETVVLAHNTQFDGLILTQIFDFHPAYWMDSLSMARGKLRLESYSLAALAQHFGLPAKKKIESKGKYWSQLTEQERLDLIEYADHDAELCAGITQLLLPYPQDELDLIDMTIRMFVEPTLRLDTDLAKEVLENEKQNKQTLIESSGLTKTQLASNLQFAAHIQTQLGYQIPTKISPTTGKETFALSKKDPEFLEFYADADEELKALLDARLAVKSTLEETRLETLIETQEFVGKIPVPLTYYGGHTGRWSGCLVASTRVLAYNTLEGSIEKCIDKVTLGDLIWDGEAFVKHDGLQFSGFREVIEHDGLTGTPDHLVFIDGHSEAISLQTAMQTGRNLQAARSPDQNALDLARATLASRNQEQN